MEHFSNAGSTGATANNNASPSGKGKGKGKAIDESTEEEGDEEEDDDEEEDEEMEEDDDDDEDAKEFEEIDPSAILPTGRCTRGVKVDYTSKEAIAKAGLHGSEADGDDS